MTTLRQPGTARRIIGELFNLSILDRKRMAWVDYLRGIAILLVVYRHVLIGIERSGIAMPQVLVTANLVFFSFRIPLFFILSGIFVGGSLVKKKPGQLIEVKFETLLYPYLIWSVIQVTIQLLLSNFTNADRSLIDYTYILYQPRLVDQFWYLPALFLVSVIYILVRTRLKPPVWLHILIGIALYFLSPLFNRVSMMSDWMEFYIFFALGDAVAAFFFHDRVQRFLKSGYSLLLSIPFFVMAQVWYLSKVVNPAEFLIIALVGCITMFIVAYRLQTWNILKFLRVAGYHSLYIYAMHVLASAAVRILLTKAFGITDPVILLACGIFFGVTLPIIFYNLLVRDNILWFLFSYKRPRTAAAATPVPVNSLPTPITHTPS